METNNPNVLLIVIPDYVDRLSVYSNGAVLPKSDPLTKNIAKIIDGPVFRQTLVRQYGCDYEGIVLCIGGSMEALK